MSGWIKLHRKLLNHWCASDPNFLAVWFRLIAEANHESKKSLINSTLIEVKRGTLIFGLNAFSNKSGVSVSKLRRIIDILEGEGMISRQKTNKFSLISITSYDKHQVNDRQNASKQHSNNIQNATPKECKEVKEDKNSIEGTAIAVLKTTGITKDKKNVKGTRLPEGWTPSETLARAIADKEGFTAEQIDHEVYQFKNYWLDKSGASACKLSWDRTFKSWCARPYCDSRKGISGTGRRGGGSQGAVQQAEGFEKAAIKCQELGESDIDFFAS